MLHLITICSKISFQKPFSFRPSGHTIAMEVDVAEFRSFNFRGEGKANVVISAKNRGTGHRIVWRFAKARKSGELSVKGESSFFVQFMDRMVSPLLHPSFLLGARTVQISIEHAHQLTKISRLKCYEEIESLSDLEAMDSNLSRLNMNAVPQGQTHISCIEMLDATCVPGFSSISEYNTVTVEIKPKQGYYQEHPGLEVPYCNNCILQIEKSHSTDALYSRMYDFCPLSLFSDDQKKQRNALESLIIEPHRNLRMFVDGVPVLSDELQPSRTEMETIMYPDGEATVDDLVEGMLLVLNGPGLTARCTPSLDESSSEDGSRPLPHLSSTSSLCSPSSSPSNSFSLLNQLLRAQRIDQLGLVKAHQLYFNMSSSEREEVGRRSQSSGDFGFLSDNSNVSLLKRYLLAATFKDCSVMISLRLVNDRREEDDDCPNEAGILVLQSGIKFAYSAKIVDLDPKSPKNMVSAYKRLKEGVELLKRGTDRPPCVSLQNTRITSEPYS